MPEQNREDTARFLSALFGDKPDDNFILIWTIPDKLSYWQDTVDGAIEMAQTHAPRKDVYVGVALSPKARGSRQRGLATETSGIVGLWADIDIASPEHKKGNLPPDVESARELLGMMGADPTILIHSGHGLQAWWLFNEPWVFVDAEDRRKAADFAERWTNTLRFKAKTKGWDVDSTFDLSRVLRVPGTLNLKNKDHPTPVLILDFDDDTRYEPDELEQYVMDDIPEATSQKRNSVTSKMAETGPLQLNPAARPDFDKFGLLADIEPKFTMTWERKRKDFQDQSPSIYDLSLATYAAMAGWSDQEIVDLIIASRSKHGDDLKLRQDYYQRTITRAREAVKKYMAEEAIEDFTAATAENGYEPPAPDRRRAIIEHLSAIFEVPITRIVKYIADQPTYRLETKVGHIMLGEVENLIGQNQLRKKVAAACGRYIPKFKGDRWDKIAQVLLDACEEETLGEEATEAGQAKSWLQGFLDERRPAPDPQEAVTMKHPFIKDGHVYIFGSSLRQWLAMSQGERVTMKQIGSTLRAIKCEPETMWFSVDGKETTRSVWKTPVKADIPEEE